MNTRSVGLAPRLAEARVLEIERFAATTDGGVAPEHHLEEREAMVRRSLPSRPSFCQACCTRQEMACSPRAPTPLTSLLPHFPALCWTQATCLCPPRDSTLCASLRACTWTRVICKQAQISTLHPLLPATRTKPLLRQARPTVASWFAISCRVPVSRAKGLSSQVRRSCSVTAGPPRQGGPEGSPRENNSRIIFLNRSTPCSLDGRALNGAKTARQCGGDVL
jgi:hypothetical protein